MWETFTNVSDMCVAFVIKQCCTSVSSERMLNLIGLVSVTHTQKSLERVSQVNLAVTYAHITLVSIQAEHCY